MKSFVFFSVGLNGHTENSATPENVILKLFVHVK